MGLIQAGSGANAAPAKHVRRRDPRDVQIRPLRQELQKGGLELGARHSNINFHEGAPGTPAADAIRGGVQTIMSGGINWYLNSVVRLMLDCQDVKIERLSPSATFSTPAGAQIGQHYRDFGAHAGCLLMWCELWEKVMIFRRSKVLESALFGAVFAFAAPASAADTQVAVAANFTEPAKEIAAAFKAATGNNAILTFGSSGQFYTQIVHGAPYEVFLSADADRPKRAEQERLGVPGSRFIYAIGRLVLFSKMAGLVDDAGAVLGAGKFQKLAIADPTAAPYGAAAVQTMRRLGVYDKLKPKIVMGSSITQVYQSVETGAAEVGFVGLSQVINEQGGSRWLVPTTLHNPINQQAVLLFYGDKNPAARAFLAFLKTDASVAIIKRYGYEVK